MSRLRPGTEEHQTVWVILSKSRRCTGTVTWVGAQAQTPTEPLPFPTCLGGCPRKSFQPCGRRPAAFPRNKRSRQAGQMEVITGGKEERRWAGRGQQGRREGVGEPWPAPLKGMRNPTRHRLWQHREAWICSPLLILSNRDLDVFLLYMYIYLMGLVKTSSSSEVENTGLKSAGLGNTLSPGGPHSSRVVCDLGRVIAFFPSLFHLQRGLQGVTEKYFDALPPAVFFSFPLNSVFSHACTCGCGCTPVYMCRSKDNLSLSPCLKQGLFVVHTAHAKTAGPQVPGDSPVSISHLTIKALGLQRDTMQSGLPQVLGTHSGS